MFVSYLDLWRFSCLPQTLNLLPLCFIQFQTSLGANGVLFHHLILPPLIARLGLATKQQEEEGRTNYNVEVLHSFGWSATSVSGIFFIPHK